MTENEAIAKFKRTSVLWESATNTEMVEAVKMAIQALEEIQSYRAIGTVEDFKELKGKMPFATVILTKDDLQAIVDEKIKEYEIEIEYKVKEIRNKAIKDCLSVLYRNAGKFISTSLYYEVYDEIAEQMKGGVDHE